MNFNELTDLNPAQQEAVTSELGNLLILAGAGSGKTRVLIHRIAWLMSELATDPYSIMAVTFTNKAAKEIINRLNKVKLHNIGSAWIGTFHGIAHKFLRIHHNLVGLDSNFEVIDSEDQLKVLRRLLKQINLNEELFEPKKVQNFINKQKDHGIRPNNLSIGKTRYDRIMFELYGKYEAICKSQNLVDFSELLLKTYELLKHNPELLQHYQSRFRHFLIDEFQDTNAIQYNFLKLLGISALSVTAVGDDDQSIYSWRGARVENIVKYTKEFAKVKIIRLEKNYRSTKTILSAANAVINNNFDRMGKTLWTDALQGDKITLYAAMHEEDEAAFIVTQIQAHIANNGKYDDLAVLYRSNAQSRAIEEALVKHNISYSIYGGVNFFERAEIKDLLAYLRLAINPTDNIAFERIINMPVRGIGERTLEHIREVSTTENVNYVAASEILVRNNENSAIAVKLLSFLQIINKIYDVCIDEKLTLVEVVTQAIEISGLLANLRKQADSNALNRIENLQELVNATVVFDKSIVDLVDSGNNHLGEIDYSNRVKIKALLDYAALEGKEYLVQDKSKQNTSSQLGQVKLMTLHAAKGLEFPIIFLCGLEEGLFPHYFSKDSQDSLNEERRLCYVGLTRAMEKIFISYTKKRRLFGREEYRIPSRFLQEIPQHLIEYQEPNFFSLNKINSKTTSRRQHKKLEFMRDLKSVKPKGIQKSKVRHPKFGVGLIIDQDGSGDKTRVNVDFGAKGTKWLLLSYANLEVLD